MRTYRDRVRQTRIEYESTYGDKNAYVCVTEWANGEGVDVELSDRSMQALFQMTWEQWKVLKKAMKEQYQ